MYGLEGKLELTVTIKLPWVYTSDYVSQVMFMFKDAKYCKIDSRTFYLSLFVSIKWHILIVKIALRSCVVYNWCQAKIGVTKHKKNKQQLLHRFVSVNVYTN